MAEKATIRFSAKNVALVLFVIILVMTSASLAGQISKYFLGHARLGGFVFMFGLDEETNIPTWYSSVTLFICSVLLFLNGRIGSEKGDRYGFYWTSLATTFCYFSMDELCMFHEKAMIHLRSFFHANDYFYFTWVVPALVLVPLFGLMFVRFLKSLPRSVAVGFIIAGIVYSGGSIGLELLSGHFVYLYGMDNFGYQLLATAEEMMEMLGVLIFIRALFSNLEIMTGQDGVLLKFLK